MKKFLTLFVVLVMLFAMGITVHADASGESGQSADIMSWLKENVSGEQQELISQLLESSDEVIEFVKDKLATGELETEEDIEEAIREGEEKFAVTLTKEDKEKILQVMQKIKKLGLDPEKLLEQVQDMYKQVGDELFENAEAAVKQSVENSVSGFFKDMGNRLKGFFANIFST